MANDQLALVDGGLDRAYPALLPGKEDPRHAHLEILLKVGDLDRRKHVLRRRRNACGDETGQKHSHLPKTSLDSEQQHDSDVNQRQNHKGITERLVNDMPQVEDLLRTGKKDHALGDDRLFPRDVDDAFQFRIP